MVMEEIEKSVKVMDRDERLVGVVREGKGLPGAWQLATISEVVAWRSTSTSCPPTPRPGIKSTAFPPLPEL